MAPIRSTTRACVLLIAAAFVCAPSASAAPAARVGAVDCDAGGAVVTLTNDGGAPVRFDLSRDGERVASVVLPPGALPAARVVPIAEGASALVAVRFGGSSTSGLVRRGCGDAPVGTAATAGVAVAPQAGVGPAAVPVVPATGTRGALAAATAPGASSQTAQVDTTQDGAATSQLDDGSSTWTLVLLAALAVAALAAATLAALPATRQRALLRERGRRART